MQKDEKQDGLAAVISAIGGLAETALFFYRTVKDNGATDEEARTLTDIFVRTLSK